MTAAKKPGAVPRAVPHRRRPRTQDDRERERDARHDRDGGTRPLRKNWTPGTRQVGVFVRQKDGSTFAMVNDSGRPDGIAEVVRIFLVALGFDGWSTAVTKLSGKNNYEATFTVGVQTFTLARGENDPDAQAHCDHIRTAFVAAMAALGLTPAPKKGS